MHFLRGLQQHFAQLLRFSGDLGDFVQHDPLTRRVHKIEDIIQARDQLMDLLTINGGNERLVQCFNSVMGNFVSSVFDFFDLLRKRLGILHALEQLQQEARPLDTLAGMLLEEVKETVLFG